MAKIKTNQMAFKELATIDQMHLAILRATFVSYLEDIVKNEAATIEAHKDSMFSGELIVDSAKEGLKVLGWDK